MKTLLASACIVAAAAISAFAAPAQAQSVTPTRTLDVYVDLPTGFTFIKMPQGWKFVGQVDAADMASLPSTVITALLPAEPASADAIVAQRAHPAMPRVQ